MRYIGIVVLLAFSAVQVFGQDAGSDLPSNGGTEPTGGGPIGTGGDLPSGDFVDTTPDLAGGLGGLLSLMAGALKSFFSMGAIAKESTQLANGGLLALQLTQLRAIIGNLRTNSNKLPPRDVAALIDWLDRFKAAIQAGDHIINQIDQYKNIYAGWNPRQISKSVADWQKWSSIALGTAQVALGSLQRMRMGVPADMARWDSYMFASDNAEGWMHTYQVTNRFLYEQLKKYGDMEALLIQQQETDTAFKLRQLAQEEQRRAAAEEFFYSSPVPDRGNEKRLIPDN